MRDFANWWVSLSWCESAALLILAFVVIFWLAILLAWWRDPLKVEMRAIKRRRRKERKLLAKTRAMLLKRHDPSADRTCFREVHR